MVLITSLCHNQQNSDPLWWAAKWVSLFLVSSFSHMYSAFAALHSNRSLKNSRLSTLKCTNRDGKHFLGGKCLCHYCVTDVDHILYASEKTWQIKKNDQQILKIIYKNVSQASPHDLAACRTTSSSIKVMSFCFTLSDSRIVVQQLFHDSFELCCFISLKFAGICLHTALWSCGLIAAYQSLLFQ